MRFARQVSQTGLYHIVFRGVNIGKISYLKIRFTYYGYDPLNRLKSVKTNGRSYSYTYDGTGLRQTKSDGTIATKFVYDGQNIIAEDNGSIITKYSRGHSLIKITDGTTKGYVYVSVQCKPATNFSPN